MRSRRCAPTTPRGNDFPFGFEPRLLTGDDVLKHVKLRGEYPQAGGAGGFGGIGGGGGECCFTAAAAAAEEEEERVLLYGGDGGGGGGGEEEEEEEEESAGSTQHLLGHARGESTASCRWLAMKASSVAFIAGLR